MRRSALSILLIFMTPVAWALEPVSTSVANTPSSTTKTTYSNSLQIGMVEKVLKANTQEAPHNQDIEFNPETPTGLALGWSNRYLGISLSGNISTSHHDEESRVRTSSQDYLFRYFKENVGLEFIYQNYKGFGLSTIEKGQASLVPESESLLPELSMRMYQIQWDWAFSGVSALESFGPNWAKPSVDGHAYYLTASISQTEISNPQPFLPQNPNVFGKDVSLTQGTYQTLAVGAGVSWLWQWTHFYMAMLIGGQAGPQLQKYKTVTDGDSETTKFVFSPQAKMALSYDWGEYYVSLIAHTQVVRVDLQDTKLGFATQEVAFFVGSRF